jgi:anti-sigma factor RsiW
MHNDGMKCSELAGFLALAADDELSPDERPLLETHLAECASCRAEAERFLRTDRRLIECREILDSVSPPPSPWASRAKAKALRRPRRGLRVPFVLAGASLAAVAMLLIVAPRSKQPPHAAAEPADLAGEVIAVELSLTPAGDPFADGSQTELVVHADMVVGPDGQARAIRLTR